MEEISTDQAKAMKIPQLKEELKKRGLPVGGTKPELVKRLCKESDADDDSDCDDTPAPTKKQKKSTTTEANAAEAETDSGTAPSSGLLDHLTDKGWTTHLAAEFNKPYFKKLNTFLQSEKKMGHQVFPPENEIFAAFNYTPFDKVKVVILGQDPYHDDGQAHGLCFSVKPGVNPPPSLKNMYKELTNDIPGFKAPSHGCLIKWAQQGVLLLNASLTVQAHKANSHSGMGWLDFTDAAIKALNSGKSGIVFILWGGFAQKKGKIIDKKKHHVIEAAHPSPLSAGKFFGCKVFSKANTFLTSDGNQPIDWNLPAAAKDSGYK